MIAVVGLNSAVDRLIDVDALVPGSVIRARTAEAWPGGKGVHAAMCAATLGASVRLAGFVDAPHRDLFIEWLQAQGVEFNPIEMPSPVRTCLAIRDRDGCTTEILEPGSAMAHECSERAIDAAVHTGANADVVVVSGSLPPGLPPDAYGRIVSSLAPRRVLVDASGDPLRYALASAPFCIKPNRTEAEALTGIALDSPASAARAAQQLLSSGVRLVVISLAADGAVAAWDDRVCHLVPPATTALNAVGAGDCLIGALATGLERGYDVTEALQLGVAAGTAKVLSPETGRVRRQHIDRMRDAIDVRWLT